MIRTEDYEAVEIRSAADLRAWLSANHERETSVWLVTYKKAPGAPYVSTSEVLDELVAFGWIDGIRRKLDETRTMQLVSRRRQQAWAQTYKDRAARLVAEGRMEAPGFAAIAASKASGLWDATAAVDALVVPADLAEELAAAPTADAFWTAAAPSYRRNVLRWLHAAKRPDTRAARIASIVAASRSGEKLPQM